MPVTRRRGANSLRLLTRAMGVFEVLADLLRDIGVVLVSLCRGLVGGGGPRRSVRRAFARPPDPALYRSSSPVRMVSAYPTGSGVLTRSVAGS